MRGKSATGISTWQKNDVPLTLNIIEARRCDYRHPVVIYASAVFFPAACLIHTVVFKCSREGDAPSALILSTTFARSTLLHGGLRKITSPSFEGPRHWGSHSLTWRIVIFEGFARKGREGCAVRDTHNSYLRPNQRSLPNSPAVVCTLGESLSMDVHLECKIQDRHTTLLKRLTVPQQVVCQSLANRSFQQVMLPLD